MAKLWRYISIKTVQNFYYEGGDLIEIHHAGHLQMLIEFVFYQPC